MPLPIWYVKREHEPVGRNPGKKITPDMRDHLVHCIGLNAIAASQRGETFIVPQGQLEALALAARQLKSDESTSSIFGEESA